MCHKNRSFSPLFFISEQGKSLGKTKSIEMPSRFGLWNSTIWQIRARFGPTVASCFDFIKWIFVLDICIAVLPLFLILVPQVVHDVGRDPSSGSSFNCTDKSGNHSVLRVISQTNFYRVSNVSYCCSQNYTHTEATKPTSELTQNVKNKLSEFIQGPKPITATFCC